MAKKHLTLGFVRSSDIRKEMKVLVQVESEDRTIESLVYLTEHEFALLMSGQCITVEADI